MKIVFILINQGVYSIVLYTQFIYLSARDKTQQQCMSQILQLNFNQPKNGWLFSLISMIQGYVGGVMFLIQNDSCPSKDITSSLTGSHIILSASFCSLTFCIFKWASYFICRSEREIFISF